MRILLLILLWFPLAAKAELFDGWTDSEKKLFAVNTAFVTLDYATTYNLLYVQGGFKELNPLLGQQPSKEKLLLFTLSRIALTYVIVDHISNHDERKKWLLTFTAISLIGPAHNLTVGAQLKF